VIVGIVLPPIVACGFQDTQTPPIVAVGVGVGFWKLNRLNLGLTIVLVSRVFHPILACIV
jgi:hypothetical protein